MLIEKTLLGTIDRVQTAIDRLRMFEEAALAKHPDGYYLAFSGGKDSIVIKDLAERAGVAHTCHLNLTTVDPPELLQYVRKHHPDVQRHHPGTTMWKLIVKNMMPPTRLVRYCCEALKEGGGKGRIVITGVRWAESNKRRKRRVIETCYRDTSKAYLHPILDWPDAEVWEYIRERELPYCRLYDEGFKRIGCVGCPNARKGRAMHFARWPAFERAYRRAFAAAVAKRRRLGKSSRLDWTDGDAMFDWWMDERRAAKDVEGQLVMFE